MKNNWFKKKSSYPCWTDEWSWVETFFSKELENNYICFFKDLKNKLLKENFWHPCLTPEYQMVSAQPLRKNKKKDVIPTYSIFQHVSII